MSVWSCPLQDPEKSYQELTHLQALNLLAIWLLASELWFQGHEVPWPQKQGLTVSEETVYGRGNVLGLEPGVAQHDWL